MCRFPNKPAGVTCGLGFIAMNAASVQVVRSTSVKSSIDADHKTTTEKKIGIIEPVTLLV
jgi:hypothetical protein